MSILRALKERRFPRTTAQLIRQWRPECCWRPLPIDGHPVLGASPARPDVYLAVMHSGVTLAPIVGQLAAHELTEDVVVDRLEEFRPGRDFEVVKRY